MLIFGRVQGGYMVTGVTEKPKGHIEIPSEYEGESVVAIGRGAFNGCAQLRGITLPRGIVSIGENAFLNCYDLEEVRYEGTLADWCQISFEDYYANPMCYAKEVYIGDEVLKNAIIPQGLTEIKQFAFSGYSSLESAIIPQGVKSIGIHAFYECGALTRVEIPRSVKEIGSFAFSGCDELTVYCKVAKKPSSWNEDWNCDCYVEWGPDKDDFTWEIKNGYAIITGYKSEKTFVRIPEVIDEIPVTVIGENAFANLTYIDMVDIPRGVLKIAKGSFCGCEGIREIKIPEGVCEIEEKSFYGCTLTEIELPRSLKEIKSLAFGNCAFSDFAFPNGITSIGNRVFDGCISLKSIFIPKGDLSIDKDAFRGCNNVAVYIGEKKGQESDNINHKPAIWDICKYGVTAEGIRWAALNDSPDNAIITGYVGGSSHLVIPQEIDGLRVSGICDCAFWGNRTITSIKLPDRISVSYKSFDGCANLLSIEVSEINTRYSTNDGILCTKDGRSLIACPQGKEGSYTVQGVEAILENAFEGCDKLTEITVSNDVKLIEEGAFHKCSGVTKITLPFIGRAEGDTKNNYFRYIFSKVPASLKEVVITGGTTVGAQAFIGDCKNIKKITVQKSVTSIGYGAFKGCDTLESITLPFVGMSAKDYNGWNNFGCFGTAFGSGLTNDSNEARVPSTLKEIIITGDSPIAFGAFKGISVESLSIPYASAYVGSDIFSTSEKELGRYHFGTLFGAQYITDSNKVVPNSLKRVTISKEKAITKDAFYECNGIEEITLSQGLEKIEESAFWQCKGLRTVNLPEGLKRIEHWAFNGCVSLGSVVIPSSVEFIHKDAFSGCEGISSFLVNEENGVYKSIGGHIYTKDGSTLVRYAGNNSAYSYTVPNGVTAIGEYAFEKSKHLTEIALPDSVKSIGMWAFYQCTNLRKINLPEDIREISIGLFCGCEELPNITLPKKLKVINVRAFEGCRNLRKIYIPKSVKKMEGFPFKDCIRITVHCQARVQPRGWNLLALYRVSVVWNSKEK